jgi:hypothetical protein
VESKIPLCLEKLRFSSEHGSKRNSPKPAPSVYCLEHAFFVFASFLVLRWFSEDEKMLMHNHQKVALHRLFNPIRRALALPLMLCGM